MSYSDFVDCFLILSFFSLWKNREHHIGRKQLPNVTFLEAYNCDGSETPRPTWADRARKQLYRPDYVPYHFVHYSAVTRGLLTIPESGKKWRKAYAESRSSERVTDEIGEATMIHAKAITQGHTMGWSNRCGVDSKRKRLGCYVGFAWPNNTKSETATYDQGTKMEYNCFVNDKVETFWIPRLNKALAERRKRSQF